MKRRLAVLLLVLVTAFGGGSWLAYRWAEAELARPRSFAAVDASREVEVRPGESVRTVLARFERDGLIGSALLARLYHSRILGDPAIQAGTYRFVSPVSTLTVLRMLRDGEVATDPLTLIEGLTIQESAEAIAAAGFGETAALLAEFRRPERIRDLDPGAPDLEGYLFPDTYRFPRGVTPAAIADRLVAAFREQLEREVRPALAPGDVRPLRELVILASLVEKEARLDAERH